MDKSLLVVIFVPTFDENGSDGGGKFGTFGTGYPVGQDLVLTARHVLAPVNRDHRYPIAIRWYYYPRAGAKGGWYDVSDDKVVWPDTEELDVALLRCKPPQEARAFRCYFASTAPQQGDRWMSAGFPVAAQRDDEVGNPANFGLATRKIGWARLACRSLSKAALSFSG
jgi:hypothetical protein